MSYAEAMNYVEGRTWIRRKEVQTGSTSLVVMSCDPPARRAGDADTEMILEVACDGDGKPQSARLRDI